MKRSLSFCAIALVAVMAHSATAQFNVQLNLRYNDPADESAGGTWDLLVGTEGSVGLAGITALLDNVNNDASAGSAGYGVFESQQVGSVVEIVTGSDLTAPAGDELLVGLPGHSAAVADDLFPGNSPAIWENNTLLASGTFGADRPALLATSGDLAAGANEFDGTDAVASTVANWNVRGDSVATDGLRPGDANRDGTVNASDLGILSNPANWLNVNAGWDEGNFNSTGGTNASDLGILSNPANWLSSTTPPAVGAVSAPEPTTAVMLVSMLTLAAAGRRRS